MMRRSSILQNRFGLPIDKALLRDCGCFTLAVEYVAVLESAWSVMQERPLVLLAMVHP
jgi:hypothetical protein